MNFNPIFFQPLNNIQGVSDSGKLQKLTANSYLFADIIKVCIEQDASLNATSGNIDVSGIKFNGLNTSDILNLKKSNSAQSEIGNEYKWDFSKLINFIKEVPEIITKSTEGLPSFFFNDQKIEPLSSEITSDLTKNEVLNFLSQALSGLKNQAATVNMQSSASVVPDSELVNQDAFSVIFDPAENILTISKPVLNETVPVVKVADLIKGNKQLKSSSSADQLISDSKTIYQVTPDSAISITQQEDYLKNVIVAALQNQIPVKLNMPQNDGNQLEIEITQPKNNNIRISNFGESLSGSANAGINSVPKYLTFAEILQSQQNTKDVLASNNSVTINSAANSQIEKNAGQTPVIQPSDETDLLKLNSQTGQKVIDSDNSNPFIIDTVTNYIISQKPGKNNSITQNYSTATVAKGNTTETNNEKASGMILTGQDEKNVMQDAVSNSSGVINIDVPKATAVNGLYSSLVGAADSKKTQTPSLDVKNTESKISIPEKKYYVPETKTTGIATETKTVTKQNTTTETTNNEVSENTKQAAAKSSSQTAIVINNEAPVKQEEKNPLLFSVKIKTKNSTTSYQETSKAILDKINTGLIYKQTVSSSSPIIKASQGNDITIDFSYMLENASVISGDFISDSSLKRMINNNKTAQEVVNTNLFTAPDKSIPGIKVPSVKSDLSISAETKSNISQQNAKNELPASTPQIELNVIKTATDLNTKQSVPDAGQLSAGENQKNINSGLQDLSLKNNFASTINTIQGTGLKSNPDQEVNVSKNIFPNIKLNFERETEGINNPADQSVKDTVIHNENNATQKISENSNANEMLSGNFADNKINDENKQAISETKNADVKPLVIIESAGNEINPTDSKIKISSAETNYIPVSPNKTFTENINGKTEPKISADKQPKFNTFTNINNNTADHENIISNAAKQTETTTLNLQSEKVPKVNVEGNKIAMSDASKQYAGEASPKNVLYQGVVTELATGNVMNGKADSAKIVASDDSKQTSDGASIKNDTNPGVVIEHVSETTTKGITVVNRDTAANRVESSDVNQTNTSVKKDENVSGNINNKVVVEDNSGFVEMNGTAETNNAQFAKSNQPQQKEIQNQQKIITADKMQMQEQPVVAVLNETLISEVNNSLKNELSATESKTVFRETITVPTEKTALNNTTAAEPQKTFIEVEVGAGSNTIIKINTSDKKTGKHSDASDLNDNTIPNQVKQGTAIKIGNQASQAVNVNEKYEDISRYKNILNTAGNKENIQVAKESCPSTNSENVIPKENSSVQKPSDDSAKIIVNSENEDIPKGNIFTAKNDNGVKTTNEEKIYDQKIQPEKPNQNNIKENIIESQADSYPTKAETYVNTNTTQENVSVKTALNDSNKYDRNENGRTITNENGVNTKITAEESNNNTIKENVIPTTGNTVSEKAENNSKLNTNEININNELKADAADNITDKEKLNVSKENTASEKDVSYSKPNADEKNVIVNTTSDELNTNSRKENMVESKSNDNKPNSGINAKTEIEEKGLNSKINFSGSNGLSEEENISSSIGKNEIPETVNGTKFNADETKTSQTIFKDDSTKVNISETVPNMKVENKNESHDNRNKENTNSINKQTDSSNKNINDDQTELHLNRNNEINREDNNTRQFRTDKNNEKENLGEHQIVAEQKTQKSEMINDVKENASNVTHSNKESVISEASLNIKKEKEEKSASISEEKNIKAQENKLENIKSEKEFNNNNNSDKSRHDNHEAVNSGSKNIHHGKTDIGNSFSIDVKPIESSSVNKAKIPFDNSGSLENNFKTVKAPDVMREISDFISKGDTKSIVLKIDPENLGKVKIVLDMTDKLVNAHIEVENQSVKNAVMNNIDNLKASLAQNGVELNSVNVSLPGYEQKNQKQMQPRKKQSANLGNDDLEEAKLQGAKSWGYNTYEYVI